MSSTNSKSAPRASGSTLILQSPNWPWPPVCFLWRPCASVDALIVSRYGIRGGFRFTSTPNRRFSFATVTSMCSCPWPDEQQLLGLRIAAVVDRRVFLLEPVHRGADLVLVAAALRLDGVGQHRLGKLHRRERRPDRALSPSVSLVSVSFSLATAPEVAGLDLGHRRLRLALQQLQVPEPLRRRPCVLLWTVESDLSVPDTTRNIVMRPANGSAMVFQTNADGRRLLVGRARRPRRRPCRRP